MTYYLTFNDNYSGVFQSQVIDIVKLYISKGEKIKLISFISLKSYRSNRRIIKNILPNSIILPAFPKLANWNKNKLLLKLFTRKDSEIICRGIFAANLTLSIKHHYSKIIYDGRGAIKAEQEEYGVYNRTGIENKIAALEQNAILNSDAQISVSKKLINYWVKNYNYTSDNYQIIPCSVSNVFSQKDYSKDITLLPGLNKDDILLIFSGSLAGWQSFENLEDKLISFLRYKNIKILFLSREHKTIEKLEEQYAGQVFRKWVNPQNVPEYLTLGDYGLLLRDNNNTNKVASPVKFAEYLSAGLKVLISENIGDFSALVKKHNLGYVLNKGTEISLKPVTYEEKKMLKSFAENNFSKNVVTEKYLKILK
jgi:hypothetical protein